MLAPDHPLAEFNEYYYLDSTVSPLSLYTYIFKFGEDGVLIELHLKDSLNNKPHGKIFSLKFLSDIDFQITDEYRKIEAESYDAIYKKIADILAARIRNYER